MHGKGPDEVDASACPSGTAMLLCVGVCCNAVLTVRVQREKLPPTVKPIGINRLVERQHRLPSSVGHAKRIH